MDAATEQKNERINIRHKSNAKRLIKIAAGFEGKTISHFILTSALERAERTVQEHGMMTLQGVLRCVGRSHTVQPESDRGL